MYAYAVNETPQSTAVRRRTGLEQVVSYLQKRGVQYKDHKYVYPNCPASVAPENATDLIDVSTLRTQSAPHTLKYRGDCDDLALLYAHVLKKQNGHKKRYEFGVAFGYVTLHRTRQMALHTYLAIRDTWNPDQFYFFEVAFTGQTHAEYRGSFNLTRQRGWRVPKPVANKGMILNVYIPVTEEGTLDRFNYTSFLDLSHVDAFVTHQTK